MPLQADIISGLVEVCCKGKSITAEEKKRLSILTDITLNSFYDQADISGEIYVSFLGSLQDLCAGISETRELENKKWEQKIKEIEAGGKEESDEVVASITSIAGANPKVIRQVLTAVINCERSSVPNEFRYEFDRLHKALGLDKLLQN